MKKFNFRFSTLLTLRKQEEKQLLGEYSIVLKEYNNTITKKEKINQQLSDLLEEKKFFLTTGQSKIFTILLSQTKTSLIKIEESLEKIKTEMIPWQEKIIAKQKQIKILENLKVQDHLKYKKERIKKEQLLLEESYSGQ